MHPWFVIIVRSGIAGVAAAMAVGQGRVLEAAEPNSFPQYTAVQCGQQGEGTIGVAGDIDYWRLQVASPTSISVFTGPGYPSPRCADTVLEIRDSTNSVIASNDDAPGCGLYSHLRSVSLFTAGNYYLVVKGYAAFTGSYAIDVACGPLVSAWQPGMERSEPNGTAATATAAVCMSRIEGNIATAGNGSAPGDHDWYAITAAAGQMVTVTTGPGDTGTVCTDTTLALRNAAGSVLRYNDDSLGLYARISYTFPTAGTYYFDVGSYLESRLGTYVIDVECGGSAPWPATYDVFAGGCNGSNGFPPRIVQRASPSGYTRIERAILGTTLVVDVAAVPSAGAAFTILGFNPRSVPFDLGPLGAVGCRIEVDPVVTGLSFASVSGYLAVTQWIPRNTSFLGATLNFQVASFDPPANALGIAVSNRAAVEVGNGF